MAILGMLVEFLALSFSVALAFDNSPLQDFCVADTKAQVLLNGLPCKDPKLVEANDFFFSGMHLGGNTSNTFGLSVTPITAFEIPGLNTLGISIVRIDYAYTGLNPPHTHPRASEILTVLKGRLEVGFVSSSPANQHFQKILEKGDIFVFPLGLVHYQRNVGRGNAVAIAALNSQNPGVITLANALLGSTPCISSHVLMKGLQADKNVISKLQSNF